MSKEQPLVSPDEQVFGSYRGPALTLFERFIRDAKAAFLRGGWEALTLYLARAFKSMSKDSLTGHFTRDAFFMVLEKVVLPRMRRLKLKEGETYGTLVILDLDRFKKVNSAYGHAGGDAVLGVFGELIGEQFRDYDVIGRVGGDEFIVIADGLSQDAVEERMLELKDAFARHPWKLERIDESDTPIEMSFSYKVISISDPDKILDLIREADRAVFKMKRQRDGKK